MLTNKAKTDFLDWYGTGENYFRTTINQLEQNANIIEWFDSVGLYIEPLIIDRDWWGYDIVEEDLMGGHYESTSTPMELEFKTRQEALTHAIETANKIYNERR